MCLEGRSGGRVGRRSFLAGSAAVVTWSALRGSGPASALPAQVPAPVPIEVAPGLVVLRRDSWGADLPAPAALPTEAPGDVRVLLVHHSASANGYDEAGAVDQIRQFHAQHTGPEKGWPDVAYNFFVDRFGRVWEGRSGSLDGPVIGDATGGNQGFSQLVCLVGDFTSEAPSPEAVDALTRVLAWLAVREGVDVTLGATTSFTSRGSNRWPAGATVDTTTIAGHRDMSQTACPGDAAYARVRGDLPALVAQHVVGMTPTTVPPTTVPPTTPPTTAPPATESPTSTAPTHRSGAEEHAGPEPESGDGSVSLPLVGAAAAAAVAAVAVPLAVRRRRDEPQPDDR
jgi:N-acetylmuramoyl-L-alanine amidase